MEITKKFDARNAEKSRAVCERMAEVASTGKRVLTERERAILDMWPKFEDGEYVWFGDEIKTNPIFGGGTDAAHAIEFMSFTYILKNVHNEPIVQDDFEVRVKRPVQSVLDADGVEIKVGDTVWYEDGSEWVVEDLLNYGVHCRDGNKFFTFNPSSLTHTRPDSWEQLEADAEEVPWRYCDLKAIDYDDALSAENAKVLDIVRRAKALAEVEEDA